MAVGTRGEAERVDVMGRWRWARVLCRIRLGGERVDGPAFGGGECVDVMARWSIGPRLRRSVSIVKGEMVDGDAIMVRVSIGWGDGRWAAFVSESCSI